MAELKHCPFCGGKAYISQEDCYGYDDNDYMVFCDNCGLQFGFTMQYDTEAEAIEAWNRRIDNEIYRP